jgi:hypothetical protein
MKNTHNLKIMVLEIFRNSKINFKMSKFEKSFARCKWVIMCDIFNKIVAYDVKN